MTTIVEERWREIEAEVMRQDPSVLPGILSIYVKGVQAVVMDILEQPCTEEQYELVEDIARALKGINVPLPASQA